MIYYFSATGNSEWVANALADGTGDRAVPMMEFTKAGKLPPKVKAGERLGIVFPVYAWRPPRYVIDFVKTLEVEDGAFVFAVATMGEVCGNALHYLKRFLRLDSGYSVKMPGNYIIMQGREPESKIEAKIAAAKRQIPTICAAIRARRTEFKVRKGPAAFLFTAWGGALFNRFATDRKFHVSAACTGCGLCAKLCPLNDIRLSEGHPVWRGDCMQCMACIQRCPVNAIEYGTKTRGRSRYVFSTGLE